MVTPVREPFQRYRVQGSVRDLPPGLVDDGEIKGETKAPVQDRAPGQEPSQLQGQNRVADAADTGDGSGGTSDPGVTASRQRRRGAAGRDRGIGHDPNLTARIGE